MNKILEISRFFYIAGIGMIPFITFPYSYTPFTLSKTYFLIFFCLVAVTFFFLSKPKEYYIPLGLGVLLLIEFLNGLLNFNLFLFPRYSEHILISATIFIYIFLGINLFKKIDLEKIIFFTSFLVTIPSLADMYLSLERTSGTFGQANFFGSYLSILILILIKNYPEYILKVNKYLLFLYSGVIVFLFAKTASISSLICLFIGMIFLKDSLKKINLKIVGFIILVLMLSLFLVGQVFIFKIQDTYNQLFKPNQTIISDSFLIRTKIWSGSIEIFKNNPQILFLGIGPNNFSYWFEKNREYSMQGLSEENFLYDKPHNYFLEILLNYGFLYLILFLFMIYKGLQENKNYYYLIAPIIFFIFFNWLDIYFKIIFFLICFSNVYKIQIKNFKFFNYSTISILLTTFVVFSVLFYRDTSYFFGNKNYVFSYKYEEVINFKVKDPIILIYSIDSERTLNNTKIKDFLLENFSNNQAILFNLDKLF